MMTITGDFSDGVAFGVDGIMLALHLGRIDGCG